MRRCYKCKSPDHVVADCPYNSDNDEDEKNKEKNEKKEKKMTFQKKKKGGGYMVTWDSDGSSDDDDSSDDNKKSLKKVLASIAINHYYRLIYHYRHFHCRSNRSVCVMLPPLVGPIARPPEEENRQLKLLPSMG